MEKVRCQLSEPIKTLEEHHAGILLRRRTAIKSQSITSDTSESLPQTSSDGPFPFKLFEIPINHRETKLSSICLHQKQTWIQRALQVQQLSINPQYQKVYKVYKDEEGKEKVIMQTEEWNSCRSNTTLASICQYNALCSPLCSNHTRPGCGQGIVPLHKQHHHHPFTYNKHKIFVFSTREKRSPANQVGDEVGELLVIRQNAPHHIGVGVDQHPGTHPPLPP